MDDADIASDRDEAEAEAPARLAASHQLDGPVPTGRCLYCDEILDDYSRWCGPGCRDQWQKAAMARAMSRGISLQSPQDSKLFKVSQ